MNRNGYGLREREYHPPVDDIRRREAEWNHYVGRGSPRSMTEDYPDPNLQRPRSYDPRDRRPRSRSPIRRPSPYRGRSPYRDRSPLHARSPYRERSRSPYERLYRSRSRSPYDARSQSPYRERSPPSYRGRSRSQSPYHDRSRSPYHRHSRSPSSPDRDYRRDDSPKRDYHRERGDRRSPEHRGRESTWARGACSSVLLRDVPGRIDDVMVREEVERFGAPIVTIRMEYEQGAHGNNERVCVVEFEGTRDATEWMKEHEGLLQLDGEKISMEYRNELDIRRGNSSPGRTVRDDRRRFDDDVRPHRDSQPSNTMIVKGLDRTTDEKLVRRSFEYITQFPIVDIRLVRDKYGMSRGFCFVQWKTVEDCKQVLEYLRSATPRFHIDGRHVMLDYSTPQGGARRPRSAAPTQSSSSNSAINAAVQVAEAAIQAAHWSRGEKDKKVTAAESSKKAQETKFSRSTTAASVSTPARTPAATTAAANITKPKKETSLPSKPATNQTAVLQPGQYPTPDTSKFQYDPTSGYYYDPITGLYYDANTRYFYNSITQQYLYWDQNKRNYIPISNEQQIQYQQQQQHSKAVEKEKKEKEQKEQKKVTAKKIAKDMERWAKAQNKKKEEFKKLLEDTPATTQTPATVIPVASTKKESSAADAAFFLLEQESCEAERRAAVKAAYHEDPFKRPDMPQSGGRKGAAGNTGLVSYMKTSDSESEEEEENEQEFEEKLLDWNKMACLLCRRGFPSKEMLQKHRELSDLHKTNLEQRRKKTGTMVKPKASAEAPTKYRDRAAERRKNIGSIAPPGRKHGAEFRAPVPYVQPTKDGLDESNIGNKMLQKMGWNKGSGLGKAQSGMTDIIKVQQRSRGVGLGMRGATYGLDGSDGDYRRAAKKITQARYMETE